MVHKGDYNLTFTALSYVYTLPPTTPGHTRIPSCVTLRGVCKLQVPVLHRILPFDTFELPPSTLTFPVFRQYDGVLVAIFH